MKSHKEGTSKNQRARKVGFLEAMPTKKKAFFSLWGEKRFLFFRNIITFEMSQEVIKREFYIKESQEI